MQPLLGPIKIVNDIKPEILISNTIILLTIHKIKLR